MQIFEEKIIFFLSFSRQPSLLLRQTSPDNLHYPSYTPATDRLDMPAGDLDSKCSKFPTRSFHGVLCWLSAGQVLVKPLPLMFYFSSLPQSRFLPPDDCR